MKKALSFEEIEKKKCIGMTKKKLCFKFCG